MGAVTDADARQDELIEDMVLAAALHYGVHIDPAGDGFIIDLIRLAVCDMLDGTIPMLATIGPAAEQWWLIEFRMADIR